MAVNDIVTVAPRGVGARLLGLRRQRLVRRRAPRPRPDRRLEGACDACGVSWGGGETPALAGVVAAGRIDLAASCVASCGRSRG